MFRRAEDLIEITGARIYEPLLAQQRHVERGEDGEPVQRMVEPGPRVDEPAVDLALCAAVVSSLRPTLSGRPQERWLLVLIGLFEQIERSAPQ